MKHRERGLTLVEIIIAAGLFGLLFATFFSAFENLLTMNRMARDLTRATLDGEEIIFDVASEPFETLRYYTPPDFDHLSDQSATVTITAEDGSEIPETDPLPALVRIDVAVRWKDRHGQDQEVTLRTLRGDYE
jgi:hypothetical protein